MDPLKHPIFSAFWLQQRHRNRYAGGLGPQGVTGDVLGAVEWDHATTAANIADRLQMSVEEVGRRLVRLRDGGKVKKVGKGWTRI